jgi:hypothetical protein
MEHISLPDYLLKTHSKDPQYPPSKLPSDLGLRKKKAGPDYRIKTLSKSPGK